MVDFHTVWFPVHYACNNQCKWCYVPQNIVAERNKTLTDQKEQTFLELVTDLGVKKVILIGGEPTIYPDLERFLYRIKEKRLHPALVTNGRRFSDKEFVKRLIDAGLKSVTFSLEGSTPEVHDRATQVHGSFYESVQGMKNALEYGLSVSTETTMSRENQGDLENIVDFLENFGLSHRLFNICGPCLSDLAESNSALTPHEGAKLFEKVYKRAKKKNVRLVTPVPICSFEQELYQDMRNNHAISHGCHILFGFNFVLDPNGDVLPCVHFTNYPLFNIFKDGKVISAEEFRTRYEDKEGTNQQFRKAIRRYPSLKCIEGNCWNPCVGGCPVFWLKYDAEKEIKGIKNL
ncbi:MAG: radical SAM protein [Candidatus Pacearchaeota archaeon]|nr:radical SAM protein [Candidatus Pacearchaeota archaeon]